MEGQSEDNEELKEVEVEVARRRRRKRRGAQRTPRLADIVWTKGSLVSSPHERDVAACLDGYRYDEFQESDEGDQIGETVALRTVRASSCTVPGCKGPWRSIDDSCKECSELGKLYGNAILY